MLHFTVGTAITTKTNSPLDEVLDTSHEFRLLKAALLYADQVTFYSYAPTSLLPLMQRPKQMSEDEKLNWFLDFYRKLGHQPHIQQVTTFVEEYKASRSRKRQDYRNYLRYQNAFAKSLHDMEEMAKRAGIGELNAAIQSGLVEFDAYALEGEADDEFFPKIASALASGETYLLLDEGVGKLVNSAIKEGIVTPLGTSINKAKQAGLSSDLFSRLPLFDAASVSEIIDIRKELSKPLVRFRAGVVGFSREIESAPWGKEFLPEVEQIFIERIQPAVLDIEDACKSNKALLEVINRSLTHPGVVTTSALGIALSTFSQFPDVFIAMSVGTGITLGAYEAFKERRKQLEEAEKNQLYFYYKAGRILSK
jgi:hypothetical protein